MASIKISSLPIKRILAPDDLLNIVDTQFGPNSYVSKRTTIADLMSYVRNSIGITTQFVLSVNGQTGVITLYLRTLDKTAITSPANLDVLLYNADTEKWVNADIINSGLLTPEISPFTAMPMRRLDNGAEFKTQIMEVVTGASVVYSINGKIGNVMLGVKDMIDTNIVTPAAGQILTFSGEAASQRWENRAIIDGGLLANALSVILIDEAYVEGVNGRVGYVLIGIKDLADCRITEPDKGEILVYDYAQARWVNSEVIDGGRLSQASSLALLTEVSVPILTESSTEILV